MEKKLEDFRSKSLIFFEEEFSCLWWKFYLDFRHIILRLSRSISREILTKQLQQRQLSEILRQLRESFFVLRQNERYAKTKRSLFETIKNKTKQKKTQQNNTKQSNSKWPLHTIRIKWQGCQYHNRMFSNIKHDNPRKRLLKFVARMNRYQVSV